MNTKQVRRECSKLTWEEVQAELAERGAVKEHLGYTVRRGGLYVRQCGGMKELREAVADLRILDELGIKPIGNIA